MKNKFPILIFLILLTITFVSHQNCAIEDTGIQETSRILGLRAGTNGDSFEGCPTKNWYLNCAGAFDDMEDVALQIDLCVDESVRVGMSYTDPTTQEIFTVDRPINCTRSGEKVDGVWNLSLICDYFDFSASLIIEEDNENMTLSRGPAGIETLINGNQVGGTLNCSMTIIKR